MEGAQRCNPMAMVQFLLAFCCTADSSDALCDAQVSEERFKSCWGKVVPVANSRKLKERLEK